MNKIGWGICIMWAGTWITWQLRIVHQIPRSVWQGEVIATMITLVLGLWAGYEIRGAREKIDIV